ncbi:phosphatidylethanolamine-binding protein [Boletus edulis BED1]|uniref:Phosphatidylethanolamine-binding protein n=1 Tax=Boletus edulis BED1 TaxID=1328754 RepID=A0AAD4GJR2_BOLED|nr:phosphatidylethanolamine-binding protein [Boletus edulis BED1]
MLSFKLLGLALALCSIPLVLAQPNNTQVEIEAVTAHFTQSGLVPAVLPKFTPSALLAVSFKGLGKIAIGQPVSREPLYEPNLSLTAANASVTLQGGYTIVMADAGPPGADQSHGQRRHWLVNGATIPAPTNANVSMVGATAVTRYIPPNPPVGDGPHRYAILVFAQPADFLPPADLLWENTGGGIFAVEDYVRYTKLGSIVAASYFTCQRGPATATLPPTSAVVSATLPGWKGPTGTTAQQTNSGLSATRNALVLFLAPIMGFLAL